MKVASLIGHPSTPCHGIDRFDVRIGLIEDTKLSLRYTIEGDLSAIRIPDRNEPCRGERLWEHTCLEAFLTAPGSTEYCEFNFAPSTAWAIYRFNAYREGMRPMEISDGPTLSVRSDPHRLEVDALIVGIDDLDPIRGAEELSVGLSAVIERSSGEMSYWALRHPSDHPDFHHSGSFALTLDFAEPSLKMTARHHG